MFSTLRNFPKSPDVAEEKKAALDEIRETVHKYMNRVTLRFVNLAREIYPEYATDDSIIYHVCIRASNNGYKFNTVTSLVEEGCVSINTKILTGVEPHDLNPYLKNAFGGKIPDPSDLLVEARNAKTLVFERSMQYSDMKRSRASFTMDMGNMALPLSKEDFKVVEPYKGVLSVAYGVEFRECTRSPAKRTRNE